MNKFAKISPAAVIILFFVAATGLTTYIDFTQFSVPNTNHNAGYSYSATIDGLTTIFTTVGAKGSEENLWWDNRDGFGVRGACHENDEIEQPEALGIEFDTTAYIEYFHITDLFHGGDCFEISRYNADGDFIYGDLNSYILFQQTDPNMTLGDTKGDYIVEINDRVNDIWFSSPGLLIPGENHEFSLAGIYHVNPIPEPATMLLFGSGLIGISFLGRKKFFKK